MLTKTAPTYRVMFEGKTLVDDSELSLIVQGNDVFGPNFSPTKPVVQTIELSALPGIQTT
ncbi:hypothetical protein G8759_06340 [Spirosoma aureum]|uniref:Uncharacterized protein n=1 Tax=Spirosoma aureum TaxID=2692134 RepID=A0A6G9AIH8_9BACT|nr:hypothetical protein [Spirosoma aureum]QIP12271.1 hypothetical protein G8759_06340 [Spirosoma aureum]